MDQFRLLLLAGRQGRRQLSPIIPLSTLPTSTKVDNFDTSPHRRNRRSVRFLCGLIELLFQPIGYTA
jgi:hypothetical protein